MDNAGHAATDKRSFPATGCAQEAAMNKLAAFVLPVIASLSLPAARPAGRSAVLRTPMPRRPPR